MAHTVARGCRGSREARHTVDRSRGLVVSGDRSIHYPHRAGTIITCILILLLLFVLLVQNRSRS